MQTFWAAPIGSFLPTGTDSTIPVGGVRVAIGFVDLGVLAETLAKHQKAQQEEGENQGASGQVIDGAPAACMQWVGVEETAFHCAKALVIVQMCLQGASADNIVQMCMC